MNTKRMWIAAAVAAVLATPAALAESDTALGAAGVASARLNFRIVIPRFLFFRVGTAGGTIDAVDFDLSTTTATLGDGTDIPATSANAGVIPVQIISNATSDITIVADTGGAALDNGATGTIDWPEIKVSSTTGNIPAPALNNAGTGSVTYNPASFTNNETGTWTFVYDNTTLPEEGTYGSLAGTEGRVTYTTTLL